MACRTVNSGDCLRLWFIRRQLPHPRHQRSLCRPLYQPHLLLRPCPAQPHRTRATLPLLRPPRRHRMLAARPAPRLPRTSQAQRRAWQAHRRPQLHHSLVEIPRPAGIHQRVRIRAYFGCKSCLCSRPPRHPGQHALHVAVDHGRRLAKRDARHRRRRVGAHARQRQQALCGSRHRARKLMRHHFGRAMQHPRPPVIAQPAPQRQHLRFARSSQRLHRRKCRQEKPVVLQHRRHPRLLQHDLRYPDAIWIARRAPRQVAFVRRIPGKQRSAHLREIACRPGLFSRASRHGFSCGRHAAELPAPAFRRPQSSGHALSANNPRRLYSGLACPLLHRR